MTNKAFVYVWANHTNGMQYIGYHKGVPYGDKYIASSQNPQFWADFETDDFVRAIVFIGTDEEAIAEEYSRLQIASQDKASYYNLNFGNYECLNTDEAKAKARAFNVAKNQDPAFKAKLAANWANATWRAKRLASYAETHADPVFQAKVQAGRDTAKADGVYKRGAQKRFENPEFIEQVKARWADPANLAKHNELVVKRGKDHYRACSWVLTEPCGNVLTLDAGQLRKYCEDTFGDTKKKRYAACKLRDYGKFGMRRYGKTWTCTKEQI